MKWDTILRAIGIAGVLVAYGIYATNGASLEVLLVIIMAIGTLVSPEFISKMKWGPVKD